MFDLFQMAEIKKLADERSSLLEDAEQNKKKIMRDMETLQGRVDELAAFNSKLEKTRKRLQNEVQSELDAREAFARASYRAFYLSVHHA